MFFEGVCYDRRDVGSPEKLTPMFNCAGGNVALPEGAFWLLVAGQLSGGGRSYSRSR